ncbi:MAG TPA: hypothetical protein EYP04_00300 [Anaerolineae bacterium]|nr:hypothetical protein [Anaerolineae bacterium]
MEAVFHFVLGELDGLSRLGTVVEIELSILSEQCLDGRIPDEQTLRREVAPWESTCHQRRATVNWRFSTADAWVKLERALSKPVRTILMEH